MTLVYLAKKIYCNPYLTLHKKINLTYTITPNVKANKEGEKGDTLHDFGGRHKTQARKEKNSNWSLTELKISAFQRIPWRQWKGKPQMGENIYDMYIWQMPCIQNSILRRWTILLKKG